jgi:hypothetical protein
MRSIRSSLRARRGVTLVELMIAAVVAFIVMGGAVALLAAGSDLSRGAGGRVALDAHMEQVLHEIGEKLRLTSPDRVTPGTGAPGSSTWVGFQRPTGIVDGALVWGSPERIARLPEPGEPIDGMDNDGDGLVDEGQIVWIRDVGLASEKQVVLARGVPAAGAGEILGNGVDDDGDGLVDEGGLAFVLWDGRIEVQVTLATADANGAMLRRTGARTIDFRNQGL